MAAWVEGRVAGKRHWTQALISLQVGAPEVTFTAGQFTAPVYMASLQGQARIRAEPE